MTAFLTFLSMFLTDIAWARYTKNASAGNHHRAALWSVAILVLGSVAITSYIHDPYMILPASIGAYFGTLFAVRD